MYPVAPVTPITVSSSHEYRPLSPCPPLTHRTMGVVRTIDLLGRDEGDAHGFWWLFGQPQPRPMNAPTWLRILPMRSQSCLTTKYWPSSTITDRSRQSVSADPIRT